MLLDYANLPSLILLWILYGSYERVGQVWFGFGWEIQLLETMGSTATGREGAAGGSDRPAPLAGGPDHARCRAHQAAR